MSVLDAWWWEYYLFVIQAVGVGRTLHHQESCIEEKLGTPDIQFGDKLFYHGITIEGDRDQKLFAFVSIDVSKIFLLSTMHLTANQLINHVLTTLCRTMIRHLSAQRLHYICLWYTIRNILLGHQKQSPNWRSLRGCPTLRGLWARSKLWLYLT